MQPWPIRVITNYHLRIAKTQFSSLLILKRKVFRNECKKSGTLAFKSMIICAFSFIIDFRTLFIRFLFILLNTTKWKFLCAFLYSWSNTEKKTLTFSHLRIINRSCSIILHRKMIDAFVVFLIDLPIMRTLTSCLMHLRLYGHVRDTKYCLMAA